MNPIASVAALTLAVSLSLTGLVSAQDIKVTSEDGTVLATFDKDAIEALGLEEIETETPWTDGVIMFEGVRLNAVLTKAGVGGASVIGLALDDYAASLTAETIATFDPIIATRMDGVPMSVNDKGPFWIMFDFDDIAAETSIELHSLAVWHLNELEVE